MRFLITSLELHASARLMQRMASGTSTWIRSLYIWPLSTCIVAGTSSGICHSVWRYPKTSFRCKWTRQQTVYPALLPYVMIYAFSSHTPDEHDQHLSCLMETAQEHGSVFNSTKCQFRQPQIAFYGAVFTAQDLWPDASKLQALQDLPTLTHRQSFSPV